MVEDPDTKKVADSRVRDSPSTLPKGCLALLVGIFFAGVVLALGDFIFGRLADARVPAIRAVYDRPGHLTVKDDRRGYRLRANIKFNDLQETADGEVVSDAIYSTDALGRRTTRGPAVAMDAERHLIMAGGSFVFGWALNDEETLPSQLAALMPDHHVYNYGLHGYGSSHVLETLKEPGFRSEIEEEAGIFVYLLIPGHVERVIGISQIRNAWGADFPRYVIDSDDKLKRIGRFSDRGDWRWQLSGWLSKTGTFRYFNIRLPLVILESHYVLTARIIEESRRWYERLFPEGEFVVVVYPSVKERRFLVEGTLQQLRHTDVPILDYYTLVDFNEADNVIHPTHDKHPTAKAHARVAERLAEDLRNRGPSSNTAR